MRKLMWGALAAGLCLAGAGATRADDIIRLGGSAAEEAIQGDTDILTRYGYGGGGYRGGYGGGYRGGYGGGYRGGYAYGGYRGGYGYAGYRGGYYGGYRGGYYGGYRGGYYGGYGRGYYGGWPFLSIGFYGRPYYGGGYYGGGYYSSPAYYPSYYAQPYCTGYDSYYSMSAYTSPPMAYPGNGAPSYVPMMPPAQGDGPFFYDGDPREPVPMPNRPVQPNPGAPRVVPIDGRFVSLPSQMTGDVTQIYEPGPAPTTAPPTPRVTYPAYGEEPIYPAPRINR